MRWRERARNKTRATSTYDALDWQAQLPAGRFRMVRLIWCSGRITSLLARFTVVWRRSSVGAVVPPDIVETTKLVGGGVQLTSQCCRVTETETETVPRVIDRPASWDWRFSWLWTVIWSTWTKRRTIGILRELMVIQFCNTAVICWRCRVEVGSRIMLGTAN